MALQPSQQRVIREHRRRYGHGRRAKNYYPLEKVNGGHIMTSDPVRISVVPEQKRVILEGCLDKQGVEKLERCLEPIVGWTSEFTLDVSGLDIEDAAAAVAMVNALRILGAAANALVLEGPQQLLVHNLYRADMIRADGPIEVRDMREDEAYG